MNVSFLAWAVLLGVVAVLVVVDLFVLHRGHHEVSTREAAVSGVGWTMVGLLAGAVVWKLWGHEPGTTYLTAFLLEKTLSIDNVAVFALLFAGLSVPSRLQHRLLSYGVLAALALRVVFIAGGLALVNRLHAVIYVFGAILVVTGLRMLLKRDHGQPAPEGGGRAVALLGRVVPLSPEYDGERYLTRRADGSGRMRRAATPLLAALVAVAAADVVFAVDSIPAAFGVTREPFLVVASNAFAVLGLRPTYFLLAGAMDRFRYLTTGLAVVLLLIGAKMLLEDVVHPPVWATLVTVAVVLGGSVVLSLDGTLRAARRWGIIALGSVVLLAGLAMLVLPGPGLLVVAAGLALLAQEVVWAHRLLHRTRDRLARLRSSASAGDGRG